MTEIAEIIESLPSPVLVHGATTEQLNALLANEGFFKVDPGEALPGAKNAAMTFVPRDISEN